jgi:hypothetical protein
MFGFGRPSRKSALDVLKERLTLPEIHQAEETVVSFYSGRNPYAHLKTEWPGPYAQFMRGFAYSIERCRKEGIVDFERCEIIASTCGVTLAKAAVPMQRAG